jgi:hypothetical protein
MLNRFFTRNLSPQALRKLYERLTPGEQANFIAKCMPYIMAPKSNEALSAQDIDLAYNKLMDAINKTNAKAAI